MKIEEAAEPPVSEDALKEAQTFCREEIWRDNAGDFRCGEPAEFVLWGKLLPPESLGPRCYGHAAKHVGHGALGDPAWAILDLRPILKALTQAETPDD